MTSGLASSDRVSPVEADPQQRALRAVLAAYQAPLLGRGLGQLASTFLPFFGLIAAMYALWWLVSPWLSLALTLPAAGLIVRIFIIQHDCGHGAFFRSRAANEWLGRFCSLITMTPFANWRRQHANHHAVWNNLDTRTGGADIYSTCLTVDEYRARSALGRWWYRAVRHRRSSRNCCCRRWYSCCSIGCRSIRRPAGAASATSVLSTDAGLLVVFIGAGAAARGRAGGDGAAADDGRWRPFSACGFFPCSTGSRMWCGRGRRSGAPPKAALLGSSHLKLPRVLQWFSGNIGFHHIHHLTPRVPNYRLEDCHRACAATRSPASRTLTLWQALARARLRAVGRAARRMVRFADVAAGS